MTQEGKRLDSVPAIKAFLLAGNATATFLNPTTGNRFTYKITKGKEETSPHFVKVLTGQNNEADYSYLGCIFSGSTFRTTAKSRIASDAPSALVFAWVWSRVSAGTDLGPVEIWHEGRCGKCGRKLTTPESITRGLGPVCDGM